MTGYKKQVQILQGEAKFTVKTRLLLCLQRFKLVFTKNVAEQVYLSRKETGLFVKPCQLNSIIFSSKENKQIEKHPAHFPVLGPYQKVQVDVLRNYLLRKILLLSVLIDYTVHIVSFKKIFFSQATALIVQHLH